MSSTGDNDNTKTTADSSSPVHPSTEKESAHVDGNVNSSKPPLPKSSLKGSKRKKSWVWDHFEKQECNNPSDQRAKCKYCDKCLACTFLSGTSCLSNHLNRCKKYPHNVDSSQKILAFQPNVIEGSIANSLASWKFDQTDCRKFLARMIIIDELPFRNVEKEGFRDFCNVMQPKFLVPSRHTIARDCFNLYNEERLKLKKNFKDLSSRVSLTTDAWTSIQNLSYMCVTAHFIDDDWKLHTKIINFCPLSSHSGEVMGKTIERCLLDWGIDKVFTITVDNASSNDLGIQYLKGRLNSWRGSVLKGEFLHMRCATHILSLTVRDGLSEVDDSISRIRSAVKYVRASPARSKKFKSCVEQSLIENKSLVCLDVPTRWNSTYLMLESALKFQKAFDLLESIDHKYMKELMSKNGLPTDMDWDYAKHLLPFLKVFYDTTLSLSGSHYVTGNEYMKQIYGSCAIISYISCIGIITLSRVVF